MPFDDNFSTQSHFYARYRPHYPRQLFAYVASLAPGHDLAWDCATGNGQAALGLAPFFKEVFATDASAQQIANALQSEGVTFCVSQAEQTSLDDQTVDLVTVAQAVHWFDLDAFYAEVQRVLRPGGVLAVWCYHHMQITPPLDRLVQDWYDDLGPYWPARVQIANEHYVTLPFPFDEFDPPAFTAQEIWDLGDLEGYLRSWSAVSRFLQHRGFDPVSELHASLAELWGPPERKRLVRWPLYLRVGRTVSELNRARPVLEATVG